MFYFHHNFGLFVGKLNTNEFHQHYAIQISVSVEPKIKLTISGEDEKTGNVFFIPSKIVHKLLSTENQLTILINPLSAIGHQLHLKLTQSGTPKFLNDLTNQLIITLLKMESSIIDFTEFCIEVTKSLNHFKCNCEIENHPKDDRIIKALEFMDTGINAVHSLKEVAEICYLSSSRFLHLFKEKTGLSFRRYQLWNKLVKSLPYLKDHSITVTAHAFGFTDSSHYTRTFKETFGVNPKFMYQKE